MSVNRVACLYVPADDMCSACQVETEIVEDYQTGDVLCTNCGLVLAERLVDFRAEWRSCNDDFGKKEDKSRAQQDPLTGKLGTSIVAGKRGDGSGDLQRTHSAAQGSSSDKKNKGIREAIEHLCGELTINPVSCNQAISTAESLGNSSLIYRKTKPLVAAACIHLTCRYNIRKLATASGSKPGTIMALSKQVEKSMQTVELVVMPEVKPLVGNVLCVEDEMRRRNRDMEKQINALCNTLDVDGWKTRQLAVAVASSARMAGTVSCRPETLVAAAVLYAITKRLKNAHPKEAIREVAAAAKITADTILKAFYTLLQYESGLLTDQDCLHFNISRQNIGTLLAV